MNIKIESSWKKILSKEFEKPYFKELVSFVKYEYSQNTIFPPAKQIFAAYDNCPVDKTKVIVIGQDPYHGENQANGLSFSVNSDVKIPPSLRNIYKEIESDTGQRSKTSGDLTGWAKQGVLLLNATLTVRKKMAGSHQNKGWEIFTDTSIKNLSEEKENLVFLLWGNYAQKKGEVISKNKGHLILKAAHPSPFSADGGFFGCKHFSKTNAFLKENKLDEIRW